MAEDGERRPAAPRGGRASPHASDGGDPAGAAKALCLRWLTSQMRCRAELAAKLQQRGVEPAIAGEALDRLERVGLIDDVAFAEAFVRAKHRDRGLGRSALQVELLRKGIDREVASRAVSTIDDDAERQRAQQLVARQLDAAILGGLEGARRRLLGMLARRGYSPSVARGAVNAALDGYVEPADVPFDDA